MPQGRLRVIAMVNPHPAEQLVHATHVVTSYEEIERLWLPPSNGGGVIPGAAC